MTKIPFKSNIIAAALLVVHSALVAYAATKHSPSIDEVGHMAAGLSHWQLGRFDLYRVNPPLVRLIATAPAAVTNARMQWDGYSRFPGSRAEFDCGEEFIHCNGAQAFRLFTLARWACIPFSVVGGYVCYRWACELYCAAGGLLALGLWCFGPNILAHAQMITPDVGATSLGAAACYLFWRWLRAPNWPRAFASGIALGAAELAKATFLLLYAVIPLSWLFWRLTGASKSAGLLLQPEGASPMLDDRDTRKISRCQGAQLTAMFGLSLYVLNLGYLFEGSLQPLGDYQFISGALAGPRAMAGPASTRRNRFAGTPLAGLRVPVPANYLLGIDHQKSDFERGYPSYLRGEWRHPGWWYYYLYGLAIKLPLGTWLLFFMAPTAGTMFRLRRAAASRSRSEVAMIRGATWRDEVVLLLPAVFILALVSSQTGLNRHLRYVLPIFPFVFIWIGRLGRLFADAPQQHGVGSSREVPKWIRSRGIQVVAVRSALAWSIVNSLWCFPHSLSYFNEFAGGPLNGHWHMLDSNIDWGQDLLYLQSWLAEHPKARPLGLAYCGYFDPRAAGVEFLLPPRGSVPQAEESREPKAEPSSLPPTSSNNTGPLPGWYAVSVMMLHGYPYAIPDGKGRKFRSDRPYYTYFQQFEPVARAGYSIYIYHLELPEVNRVRRSLGLDALARPSPAIDRSRAAHHHTAKMAPLWPPLKACVRSTQSQGFVESGATFAPFKAVYCRRSRIWRAFTYPLTGGPAFLARNLTRDRQLRYLPPSGSGAGRFQSAWTLDSPLVALARQAARLRALVRQRFA